MNYKPQYLLPDQLADALEAVGFILKGKGRPDANDKVQAGVVSHDKGLSVSFSAVPVDTSPRWENAHRHEGQDEIYTVLTGRIILAMEVLGSQTWRMLGPGDTITVPEGVVHNALVFPGTVSCVSKLGENIPCPENSSGNDWWGDPDFDEYTKGISVLEAEAKAQPVR